MYAQPPARQGDFSPSVQASPGPQQQIAYYYSLSPRSIWQVVLRAPEQSRPPGQRRQKANLCAHLSSQNPVFVSQEKPPVVTAQSDLSYRAGRCRYCQNPLAARQEQKRLDVRLSAAGERGMAARTPVTAPSQHVSRGLPERAF